MQAAFIQGEYACRICGLVKPIDGFSINKKLISGHCHECRICTAERSKKWYTEHSENRFKWRIDQKKKSASNKRWQQANRKKCCAYSKKWKLKHPDKVKDYILNYRKLHPDKIIIYNKNYLVKKRSTPHGNINHRMSRTIGKALRENKNGRSWESLVGYTSSDLRKHLESNFTSGMNWDAFLHSKIHIDHIIPLSRLYFDSISDPTFKFAWSLNNLRPMWATENIKKSNKLIA